MGARLKLTLAGSGALAGAICFAYPIVLLYALAGFGLFMSALIVWGVSQVRKAWKGGLR